MPSARVSSARGCCGASGRRALRIGIGPSWTSRRVRSGVGRTPIQRVCIGGLLGRGLVGDGHQRRRWCGGEDARDGGGLGSLMRHYLTAGAVASLAGRVPKPTGATLLIAPAGVLERDAPGAAGACPRAVPLPPITPTAQEEELLAVRPDTEDQPQRIHALPRSGRGGWTSTLRCAKKGAATVALPRVMPPEGPGCRDSGPSPSAPSRERSTSTSRAPATDLGCPGRPVANSALFRDRQHRGRRVCYEHT